MESNTVVFLRVGMSSTQRPTARLGLAVAGILAVALPSPVVSQVIQLSAINGGFGPGFVMRGSAPQDNTGRSCASAGDVNGDGIDDVIVGQHTFSVGGYEFGRAAVIFGRTDQTQVPVDISQISSGSGGGFTMRGEWPGSYTGFSVSGAGDVNGDGLGDVIVGAYLSSLGEPNEYSPNYQAGRTYVVFGKTDSTPIDLISNTWAGFKIDGQGVTARTGTQVSAAGDVNGDGLSDLIVSGLGGAGFTYVVFGKTDNSAVELSTISAGLGGGYILVPENAADGLGVSCGAAGDINGDGLTDLIVGAPNANGIGVSTFSTGRAYVVFGKSTSTPINMSSITAETGPGFTIVGAYFRGSLGRAVASGAGDVNGDGLADIFLGMARGQISATQQRGEGQVVFGKTTTTRVEVSDINNGMTSLGFAMRGESPGDYCGFGGSGAGDINGDGISDVIIGAPFGNAPVPKAYVIFSEVPVAVSGTYKTIVAAGDPDAQGAGTHRFGNDEVVFPDSRAWVDFSAGTGPGLANSSEVAVTLTRNDAGITGFDLATVANAQWQLTTNRTGYGTARVTVRYTNAEIAGLTEANLVMYSAPTAAGPFTAVPGFALNAARNQASGDFTSLPAVFVLSTAPPGGGPMLLDGDANDDGAVSIADVTAIHNDLAGIASLTPDGVANLANIGGVSVGAADAILDHLANGAPLP